MHKATVFLVYKVGYSSCNTHWAYKSCCLFLVNNQAYTVFQNHQKTAIHLTVW